VAKIQQRDELTKRNPNLFLLSSKSSACKGTLCPFGHPQGMPQQEGDGEQVGGDFVFFLRTSVMFKQV